MASSGRPSNEHPAQVNDGHAAAQVHDVLHDVGGENHDHLLADLGQQVVEAVALAGIEPGRGLVHNQQLGVADQGLGDAEALAHAAGKSGERFLPHLVEIAPA